MSTATQLITAAEYARMPDPGFPTELVRGEIIEMPQPGFRHGQVCGNVYFHLRSYLQGRGMGHVATNDAGILTERDPDTVRGGDVVYVSHKRLPSGEVPKSFLEVAPDLVVEVVSPSERRSQLLRKVAEYLDAGVTVVCVLDPTAEAAELYFQDRSQVWLSAADDLTLPDVLPGFRVPVRDLFAAEC